MAYTWEPKWEVFEVDIEGIKFRTCRDRITGLIACPICIHAASKCLSEKAPLIYTYENVFFYTVEDLLKHMKGYHLLGLKKRVAKLVEKLHEEK